MIICLLRGANARALINNGIIHKALVTIYRQELQSNDAVKPADLDPNVINSPAHEPESSASLSLLVNAGFHRDILKYTRITLQDPVLWILPTESTTQLEPPHLQHQ
jgi:hypothetical protein